MKSLIFGHPGLSGRFKLFGHIGIGVLRIPESPTGRNRQRMQWAIFASTFNPSIWMLEIRCCEDFLDGLTQLVLCRLWNASAPSSVEIRPPNHRQPFVLTPGRHWAARFRSPSYPLL